MKKLLCILLAILSCSFVFTGCESNNTLNSKDTTESETTLQMDDENKDLSTTDVTVLKPDNYPNKTITWIVPAAAGAAIDIATRKILETLDLGGNVVIENIAGASQTIGTTEANNRKADGYTLLTSAMSNMIMQPIMNGATLSYDTSDFRHIALLTNYVSNIVCVRTDSDINTGDDFVKYVTSGKSFKYSGNNAGSLTHIATVITLNQLGSTAGSFVPYSGSSEAIKGLLSNEVDFITLDSNDAYARQQSGELKMVMVLSDENYYKCPEVSKASDFGITGADALVGLTWLSVKKDTPDEIVEYIKQQVNKVVYSEDFQNYLDELGRGKILKVNTEDDITDYINKCIKTYTEVLKELGMC